MRKEIKIGLFGFGCVGQGLWDVLSQSNGFKAEIVKICVKNKDKQRSLPADYFTFDKEELLNNPEINTIVELIDDADEAYQIVTRALRSGKNVVTANKKLVANHLEELVELQKVYGVSLLYEASACGSIPIIRNLEEYYDNELLHGVNGIFNGSSNYILSKVCNEGLDYTTALQQAQQLGFAETDPTLDVGGYDAKFKLIILTLHSYGLFVKPEAVLNVGIQHLSKCDLQYAKEKGLKLKLVPTVRKISKDKITLFVLPQLISEQSYLYNVENEYNGVIVEAAFADKQFFMGKGAGGHPTGTAVLSDISALQYDYRYEYKKLHQHSEITYDTAVSLEVYLRYTDDSLLQQLDIENITEQYASTAFKYVVGTVNLSKLIANKALLQDDNVFIASTGKITPFMKAHSLETFVEEEEQALL